MSPTSWALPYWNYGRPGTRSCRRSSPHRNCGTASGQPALRRHQAPRASTQRTAALAPVQTVPGPGVLAQPFSAPSVGVATFGGTASGWHHFREPGAQTGGVEGTPHNDVHGFVGGNMWRFATAGLDPVFWLHHCNIDRYWEVRGHAADPSGWAAVGVRLPHRPRRDRAGERRWVR